MEPRNYWIERDRVATVNRVHRKCSDGARFVYRYLQNASCPLPFWAFRSIQSRASILILRLTLLDKPSNCLLSHPQNINTVDDSFSVLGTPPRHSQLYILVSFLARKAPSAEARGFHPPWQATNPSAMKPYAFSHINWDSHPKFWHFFVRNPLVAKQQELIHRR